MGTSVTMTVKIPQMELRYSKMYRQAILTSLDESMDEIRRVAQKDFLIPDHNKDKSTRAKRRLQPTDPTRLTSRTGALNKMLLLGIGDWRKGTSTHKSSSAAIQCVSKTKDKNTYQETYEATIGFNIKSSYAISSVRTAQQLAGRFLWDMPAGVRGTRRPLLSGAAKQVDLSGVEFKAKNRLRLLGVL